MATLKTIAAALKLIDTKKENLRKAFEDLQSQSSHLSSFSLSWPEIDSHFTSVQHSLTQRFELLESFESIPTSSVIDSQSKPASLVVDSAVRPEVKTSLPVLNDIDQFVVPRGELKSLCEKMDGKGLRKYINENTKDRNAIRVELPGAIRCAPDPGMMILDAMEGFYSADTNSLGDKDQGLCAIRRSCVLLLEQLMVLNPNMSNTVRERAKKLAFEWKGKLTMKEDNPLEVLGILHLVETYGLASELNRDELVDYCVIIARYRQAAHLCRAIGLVDKIPDLIQKLVSEGKQLLAVKFIFEFELTDKFQPVPLLKAYLTESKKLAQKIGQDGRNSLKSVNEATDKEVGALKSIIKIIQDHKLESEYPPGDLEKHIQQLQKEKADRKCTAPPPAANPQQQQAAKQQSKKQKKHQQQSGSKQPRTTAPAGPPAVSMTVAGSKSTVSTFEQSRLRPTGLLPEPSYLSSTVGPFGLVGSAPTLAPYMGSSAGLYGLPGAPLGYPGNLNPPNPQIYSSDSHMTSTHYDRPSAYGGYGVPPHYHPSYYPQ